VGFVLVKAYEWTSKISAGQTFPHNDFYMSDYMLTGIRLFRVLLGLVFLGVVSPNCATRTSAAPRWWRPARPTGTWSTCSGS
jgi:nitric oxide reductase NorE protein